MKVMYVASNPADAKTLEISREINSLQERLERGVGADPIVFYAYPDLGAGALAETIKRVQPDVLHFAAHGDEDAIVLDHADEGAVKLRGDQLAALLSPLPVKPKLIVINACSSNRMACALAETGAADFVIGTDAPITNTAAREMAAALYQRLADGASVAEAFTVAAANLDIVGQGEVAAELYPSGALEAARTTRLVDPMRILACFPKVDEWLDHDLTKPDNKFQPEWPEIMFGVAGAPAAARQTVFFTDDESIQPKQEESLEEARSWIIETQPVDTEIWIEDYSQYYGDMNWYAAISTTDGRVFSVSSKTADALRRYYFDERWKGDLPKDIAEVIQKTIENLRRHNGSRRGRSRGKPGKKVG